VTSPEVREPRPSQTRPAATPTIAKADSTPAEIADAYCVLMITPYGKQLRRLYLSLHSATAAVQRAKLRGLPARLVLCQLVPVQADLDLAGSWSE
jgi:hypothetical protein